MIGLNLVYAAAGIVFAVFALLSARDRPLSPTAEAFRELVERMVKTESQNRAKPVVARLKRA